jgi:hypothetical protein
MNSTKSNETKQPTEIKTALSDQADTVHRLEEVVDDLYSAIKSTLREEGTEKEEDKSSVLDEKPFPAFTELGGDINSRTKIISHQIERLRNMITRCEL